MVTGQTGIYSDRLQYARFPYQAYALFFVTYPSCAVSYARNWSN